MFFNEGWVPYDDRQNYLLDADVGVSTHFDHLEAEFSFRTRVLDYLWAGLPVVTTGGDSLAQLVADEHLGLVVPPEDPDALAVALERALADPEFAKSCRDNLGRVAPQLAWSKVLEPLTAFCGEPRKAPDLARPEMRRQLERALVDEPQVRRGWRDDLRLAGSLLREGGPRLLVDRTSSRVKRMLGRTESPTSDHEAHG